MPGAKLFGMPQEKGRWLFLPLSVLMMLCVGTLYTWSLFRAAVEQSFTLGATASLLPYTVVMVVFALFMPIAGMLIDRFGPRPVALVGTGILGTGYIASGYVANIWQLVITYGLIAGMGSGIIYGTPLAVIARWFPDCKGLAVGLTVMGFGLSPVLTAPLVHYLIDTSGPNGWQTTLMLLGVGFTIILGAIATTLHYPPDGWHPPRWAPPIATLHTTATPAILRNSSFQGLWICLAIAAFAGSGSMGIAAPMAMEWAHLDAGQATWCVSIFAVFNGLNRPLFGWLTDRSSPKIAAIACYMLIMLASGLMLTTPTGNVITYLIAFCLMTGALGGWVAIAPTATLQLCAPEQYSKTYGTVFTASGAGVLLGTLIAGQIRDQFNSYIAFFYVTGGLALVGMIVAETLLPGWTMTSKNAPQNATAQAIYQKPALTTPITKPLR